MGGRLRQAVLTLLRLHGLCGERSNVPREARYFTERRIMLLRRIIQGKNDLKIENLGNFRLKLLGIYIPLRHLVQLICITKDL